mmetsp:Transcript_42618/g.110131  ORF Transcript_42618/g.110131 Transcript_42618/m.110131 type:complete len:208 (-) Transcript_42618:1988-2611(-)
MPTGMPSDFSTSPCKKNSSHTRLAHLLLAWKPLIGLAMSHMCRMVLSQSMFSAWSTSSRYARGFGSFGSPRATRSQSSVCRVYTLFTLFTMSKWFALSVERIVWMQTARACLKLFLPSCSKMLVSCFWQISKSLAQCIFSSGDLSLYSRASSLWVSIRNGFVFPTWPRSWPRADTKSAKTSTSESHSIAPKSLIIRKVLFVTSTPCA